MSTGKRNDKSGVISKADIYMLVITLICYINKLVHSSLRMGWNPHLPPLTKITDVVSERIEAYL